MLIDPYPHYAAMRANAPVHFNATLGMWEVYRYHDIQAVLGDPHTFSSDLSALQTLATMDPPRHTQLRRLVARAFTQKLMASLEPSIAAITQDLLDRVAPQGRMDVIADLAFPLPVTVIAELLGLPAEDRGRFKEWSVPAIKVAESELYRQPPAQEHVDAVGELMDYLERLARLRLEAPREDLVSGLVHAEVEGERLTMQEITSTCRLLLIAGFETTTNLIGNTAQLLLAHPAQRARVEAEPSLLPSAIDEAARYHAPFQFLARKATRDTAVGGHEIRAGQMLLILNASGNRDEAAFEHPDRFDVAREPNRHLSFGHGIHYCLGAHLGRLEARIGVGQLLQRFAGLALDPAQPAEPLDSMVLYGWRKLPVRFAPAGASSR
jgi:cytochrome P450